MNVKTPVFQFDDVRIEPESFRVWKAGRLVPVEPKAFEVLLFLVQHRGRLIAKRELLDAVWKDAFVTENALTREIAQIRKALGEDARAAKYIQTVPTRGYRFIAELEGETEEAANEQTAQTAGANGAGNGISAASPLIPQTDPTQNAPTAAPRHRGFRFLGPLVILSSLIVLAITVAVSWFPRQTPPGAGAAVQRLTQVTTSVGLDFQPSLSPDGGYVAYSSDQNGGFEIFVRQVAPGGREIQVTSDGGRNFQPAWSPDGQHIAFHSQQRGGLWLVPALGGVARRLTAFGSKPSWSRDGQHIAFQSAALADLAGRLEGATPPSTLWVVAARGGGEPRQITQPGSPPGGHGAPI
ncbi:MAG: winged helix-turn-helix domain-containing protein, partial [Pyrinomonadaceae bacterium]